MDIKHTAPTGDFSDKRVFFTLDPIIARRFGGGGNLHYGQSANGPTHVEIGREVSDANLAMMADRHGLVLDELRAFRDQADVGATVLATPACQQVEAEPA